MPICPSSTLMTINPFVVNPIMLNCTILTPLHHCYQTPDVSCSSRCDFYVENQLESNLTSNFSRKFSWTGKSLRPNNKKGLIWSASFKRGLKMNRQTKLEAHSPRHLREAELAITIKVKHHQLRRKKIKKIPPCTGLHTLHIRTYPFENI